MKFFKANLTGTNFSISAAVGFVSIFGVAIMDGLLLISYCNRLRHDDVPLYEDDWHFTRTNVHPSHNSTGTPCRRPG